MSNFINIITEWPLIVQGALGSGLFWLVLLVGQKASAYFSKKLSTYSVARREHYLNREWQKFTGLQAHYDGNKELASSFMVGLIYQSLRSIFTGLIWLALGLTFNSVIPVLGVVGFIGCIYYMFEGLSAVQRVSKENTPAENLVEIEAELKKIQLNKSSKKDAVTGASS